MDQIEREILYNTAWKHWGMDTQLDICIEEMAEFMQAILKDRRNCETYSHNFCEELADVSICMEQIETQMKRLKNYTTDQSVWDRVEQIKSEKLNRLQERLMTSMIAKHSGGN